MSYIPKNPSIAIRNDPFLSGSLSWTLVSVIQEVRILPLSFITICRLNPKNQSIVELPISTKLAKTLLYSIHLFLQALIGFESTKVIPILFRNNKFSQRSSKVWAFVPLVPQNNYRKQFEGVRLLYFRLENSKFVVQTFCKTCQLVNKFK